MTPSELREEASRSIVEAQLLLATDPGEACKHLLRAWTAAMRLAYPPRSGAPSDAWMLRLLEGAEPRKAGA